MLHEYGQDQLVIERFGLDAREADLGEWDAVVESLMNPQQEVTIAMVGKYMELLDAYKSLIESLLHAGIRPAPRSISTTLTPKTSSVMAPVCWNPPMPSWCRAALANGAWKARSALFSTPVKTRFRIWASAWVCKWRLSNTPA